MARITIYFGYYGSGKTELSLLKAFSLSKKGYKVTLVDLDIVNPYFRSGEQKDILNAEGIKVIRPNFEGTNVAIPSLPGEINSVFVDKSSRVIFDVGGSQTGAAAIGRYSNLIKKDDFKTFLVVNVLRPFSSTANEITDMAKEISGRSRLSINYLINNTNAAYDTTPDMVEKGQIVIESAAKLMHVKLSNIFALEKVIKELSPKFIQKYDNMIKPIKLRMRPEWLDFK